MTRKKASLSNKENVAPKVNKYKLRSGNPNVQEPQENKGILSLSGNENLITEVKNSKLRSGKANTHKPQEKAKLSALFDKENMNAAVKKSNLRSRKAVVHEPQEKVTTSSSSLFDKENIIAAVKKSHLRSGKAIIHKPQEKVRASLLFDKENMISVVRKSNFGSGRVKAHELQENVRTSSLFNKENIIATVNKSTLQSGNPNVHKTQENKQTSSLISKENLISGVKKSKLRNAKETLPKPQDNVRTSSLFGKENLTPKVKKSKLQRHDANACEPEERDAIYEFTYDPKEEPPNKKGRKQKVKSKAKTRPKLAIITNNNYEKYTSNKLETLKNTLQEKTDHSNVLQRSNENEVTTFPSKERTPARVPQCDDVPSDYSPAPLPQTSQAVTPQVTRSTSIFREDINQKDPLNLLDEPSFDYEPVASSSFNTSVRHPEASPWRVEFNELPIKWQVNSYTKSNMTPAVETSFVNFNESQKKHVYTNLVPEAEETLPDIINENGGVRLKQTSLIDFITDAAVRSVKKQKRKALKETDIPSRANLPKTALNFCPSSELVNKLYDEMKTATEAPEVPAACEDIRNVAVEENASMVDNDESQSCHLFEDVDVVHHLKPSRKSYSRAKKVAFIKPTMDSMLSSDDLPSDIEDEEAEYSDSTFELPNVKNTRKINRKKKAIKKNKKEAEEVEAWAAAFNSMCEDVDEFDLVIE